MSESINPERYCFQPHWGYSCVQVTVSEMGLLSYSQLTNVFPYMELNGKYSISLTLINCTLYHTAQFSPIYVPTTAASMHCCYTSSPLHTHTHTFCCYQQSLYVSPTNQMPPHLMGKRRKAMLAKSEYLRVVEEEEGGWPCLYGEYQARRLLRCM